MNWQAAYAGTQAGLSKWLEWDKKPCDEILLSAICDKQAAMLLALGDLHNRCCPGETSLDCHCLSETAWHKLNTDGGTLYEL
jgi:hypothetical protein